MYIPENEVSAFISYGEKKCMYTLWVIVDKVRIVRGEEVHRRSSRYIKNLSTKKEDAITKAVEYAASKGIEFVSTANADKLLEEIQRRTAEEIRADQEESQRRAEEAERKAIEARDQKIEELVVIFEEQFQSDKFTFGKYEGKTFSEIMDHNPKYIQFILDNNPDCPYEYPTRLTDMCINSLYNYVQENGYPKNPLEGSEYVGNYKDRVELNVKVMDRKVISGFYGDSVLYKFLDENGNLLVTFYSGSSWKLNEGDKVTIVGTVDNHEVYDSVKQTTLKRVKVKG